MSLSYLMNCLIKLLRFNERQPPIIQTVILTNGELAAALLSLPERNREIIFLYFFGDYTQQKIGEMYGRCRSTTGYLIRRTLQLLHKEMEVLSHGESEPFTL